MFEFLPECNAEAEGKSRRWPVAQLVEQRFAPAGGREFASGRTNTLKITEES